MSEARFPKRCNGAIKVGTIHWDSIKLAVIVMVFGLASGHINLGIIAAIISMAVVETLFKKFGRGVLKHLLWVNGLWISKGPETLMSPAIRRLIK